MDVSSSASHSRRAFDCENDAGPGNEPFDDNEFPDLSIRHLIARLILARGAVVRETNPDLADEYLKFATVFQ